jgi:DNA-binding IclR family transcriptional regulator
VAIEVCASSSIVAAWADGAKRVSTSLSQALRRLLDAHVDSFEKLELLMLLRRAPEQGRTAGELARALDLDAAEVGELVSGLVSAGLVAWAADGAISLSPRTAEERAAMDELARVYDEDRITLVKAIAETAMDRLRNLAGRAFAEAFVIRKKPGGDDDR